MPDAYKTHYARLLGKTITRIVKDTADQDIGTVYGFELDSGETIWILCDPEGNGPGFLEITG